MGQTTAIPAGIDAELRDLRRKVESLYRTGGYGTAQAIQLPDEAVTLDGEQELTNKHIDGSKNTLVNIGRDSLPAGVVFAATADAGSDDADIDATILPFTPAFSDTTGALRVGNSLVAGHYRKQGKHVWFKAHLTVGSTFTSGQGTVQFTVPWAGIAAYNQPLTFHMFQQTTVTGGYMHWVGVAELVAGTQTVHLLAPYSYSLSNVGQITGGPSLVPYPGPAPTWQVFSPGSKLWISGDVFIQ